MSREEPVWTTVPGSKKSQSYNLVLLLCLLSRLITVWWRRTIAGVTRQCPGPTMGGSQNAMCGIQSVEVCPKPVYVQKCPASASACIEMRFVLEGLLRALLAGRCWFINICGHPLPMLTCWLFSCEGSYPPLQNLLLTVPKPELCAVTDPIIIIILYLHN